LYRLERDPGGKLVDVDHSYELFMNVYSFEGMQNSEVFRDDNASGVFAGVAISFVRPVDEMLAQGDTTRAETLMNHLLEVFPEFWQTYATLSELAMARGDTGRAVALYQQLNDTLTSFLETNPSSQNYLQDLGTAKFELGRLTRNSILEEDGLRLLRKGWEIDMNSGMAFRKLVLPLSQAGLDNEVRQVARQYAQYKRNLTDPLLQNILGIKEP
jgi:tetratricopeptide (TPR) repeat protein